MRIISLITLCTAVSYTHLPLLSIRCGNKAYFSIGCRFSSEISMLRVPEALVCIVYIVVLF